MDENNMFTMPVAPFYGGYGNGCCNDLFGGGCGIWLLLIIALMFGGFGNGFGGFGGATMGGTIYPWMNQAEVTQNGFRDQMINGNINSIRDDMGDIQLALANGFANVEQGANARQMASLERSFDSQTATMQGMNALQGQLANCCCENRLASCQTQNIVQNEGNSTRFADAQNTRDIIANQTANTQAILDKLCQLELDGVKGQVLAEQRENNNLRTELMYARGQASQIEQTAQLENNIYNRLKNCPVGTTPVYGNQPIFTCPQNINGCGCGCSGM